MRKEKDWYDVRLLDRQAGTDEVIARVRSKGLAFVVAERLREIYRANAGMTIAVGQAVAARGGWTSGMEGEFPW